MASEAEDYGWIHRTIDWSVGVENVRQMREDLQEIIFEKSEKFQHWTVDKGKTQRKALEAANRAKESKWDKIAFWLGAIGVVTFFVPVVPQITGIAGFIVSLFSGVRRTAVEVLIYENPYQFSHPNNVKFAYAWNQAMDGATSLLLIPMGIIVRSVPDSYRIALWVMADVIEEEY